MIFVGIVVGTVDGATEVYNAGIFVGSFDDFTVGDVGFEVGNVPGDVQFGA